MARFDAPQVFEVERDRTGGELDVALTTTDEVEARDELHRRGDGWRLVSYPLGNKRLWELLVGPAPATTAWPYGEAAS